MSLDEKHVRKTLITLQSTACQESLSIHPAVQDMKAASGLQWYVAVHHHIKGPAGSTIIPDTEEIRFHRHERTQDERGLHSALQSKVIWSFQDTLNHCRRKIQYIFPGITFIGFSIIKYTMEKFTIFVCIFLKDTYLCFIE